MTSMRLSFFALAIPAAIVLSVFACGDDVVNTVHVGPDVPEGGMVLDDGAVVGPDGDIVKPDTSKPSLVNVSTDNLGGFGTRPDYVLAVPKTYATTKQYPLVLVFHGDGGDGSSMRTLHTLDDVTGDDAIIVYPSGKDNTWDLSTAFAQNEDQLFVEALITSLKGKYSIDAARVFAVGYSSGGFLVNQLSCRRRLFRGITSFAGGAPYELPPNDIKDPEMYQVCPNAPKVAAFVVHGTADATVRASSGDFDAQFWAHYNGCNTDTSARVDTPPSPCKKHVGCPTANPVTFCLIPGLGHIPWDQGTVNEWAFFKSL